MKGHLGKYDDRFADARKDRSIREQELVRLRLLRKTGATGGTVILLLLGVFLAVAFFAGGVTVSNLMNLSVMGIVGFLLLLMSMNADARLCALRGLGDLWDTMQASESSKTCDAGTSTLVADASR